MNKRSHTFYVHGKHISIRPWKSEDDVTQRNWPAYSDPLHELWNLPKPISLGDEFMAFFYTGTGIRQTWGLEDRSGRLIGRISLREIERFDRRARLGISLAETYLGQGIGTEALTLFLGYFFGLLDFRTMLLDVAAFNRRAVRCYEGLGFSIMHCEWRSAGNNSCLLALEDPSNRHLTPFFRRETHETLVQFFEMKLDRTQWSKNRCLGVGS